MTEKVLFVSANGGHLTEMRYIHSCLDCSKYDVVWASYRGPDTKHLQGYFSPDYHNRFLKLFFSSMVSVWVMFSVRPSKVLATSDMISLPYAILCRVFAKPFLYFDCATRVQGVSYTARLIERLGYHVLVQHKQLEATLPNAKYRGGLI